MFYWPPLNELRWRLDPESLSTLSERVEAPIRAVSDSWVDEQRISRVRVIQSPEIDRIERERLLAAPGELSCPRVMMLGSSHIVFLSGEKLFVLLREMADLGYIYSMPFAVTRGSAELFRRRFVLHGSDLGTVKDEPPVETKTLTASPRVALIVPDMLPSSLLESLVKIREIVWTVAMPDAAPSNDDFVSEVLRYAPVFAGMLLSPVDNARNVDRVGGTFQAVNRAISGADLIITWGTDALFGSSRKIECPVAMIVDESSPPNIEKLRGIVTHYLLPSEEFLGLLTPGDKYTILPGVRDIPPRVLTPAELQFDQSWKDFVFRSVV